MVRGGQQARGAKATGEEKKKEEMEKERAKAEKLASLVEPDLLRSALTKLKTFGELDAACTFATPASYLTRWRRSDSWPSRLESTIREKPPCR